MKFELLADRPQAVALVCRWYFEEWGRLHPAASINSISEQLANSMNRDCPPLVDRVLQLAQDFGIKKLYLQTEKLDGGLYRKLGWHSVEVINNKGATVLVMEKNVDEQ